MRRLKHVSTIKKKGTIIKVIDVAFLLLTGKSRRERYEQYSCDVRKGQVAL